MVKERRTGCTRLSGTGIARVGEEQTLVMIYIYCAMLGTAVSSIYSDLPGRARAQNILLKIFSGLEQEGESWRDY